MPPEPRNLDDPDNRIEVDARCLHVMDGLITGDRAAVAEPYRHFPELADRAALSDMIDVSYWHPCLRIANLALAPQTLPAADRTRMRQLVADCLSQLRRDPPGRPTSHRPRARRVGELPGGAVPGA